MPIRLFDSLGHLDTECLDLFCAGRLTPAQRDQVLLHLAICEGCQEQERLERSFRHAVTTHQHLLQPPRPATTAPWTIGRPAIWGSIGAVAASLLLVLATSAWWTPVAPVDVTLFAMRGGPPKTAPAGPPLRLRLDQAGLPETVRTTRLAVDLVDADGHAVRTGYVRPESGSAIFESERPLNPGRYWVRLRQGDRVVREYELKIE